MLSGDVLFSSVTDLAEKIRKRALSPVELTKCYLERLAHLGRQLNAVVTILPESGLREAHIAEREIVMGRYRGPLHGIPYGVKDLIATHGVRTTWGAPPYRDQVFDYDATVVARLRKAGAVLIGKLALIELAGTGLYRYTSASDTGPALNPWNTGTWAGGSSSGSAAATAAALVGFSIGSETWGSILIPASFCGVCGLRPTYGRVSRHGVMPVSWSMDKVGPICRSVADCGVVLASICGYDALDPSTFKTKFRYRPEDLDARGMRIGIVSENFAQNGEAEVEHAFNDAVDVLRALGADVCPIQLPRFPYASVATIIISADSACFLEELRRSGRIRELADVAQQAGIEAGSEVRATEYLKAMRLRTILKAEYSRIWETLDVLIAPTFLLVAPPIEEEVPKALKGLGDILAAGNLLGLPSISVPCGFGRDNLPVGLSIVGKPFDESTVLRIGNAFQKATSWHLSRPTFT
jgi:aspartyl-tRNA(Asn)/glutamyl-tRNA(Gln) amidotransferase subunit A